MKSTSWSFTAFELELESPLEDEGIASSSIMEPLELSVDVEAL